MFKYCIKSKTVNKKDKLLFKIFEKGSDKIKTFLNYKQLFDKV